MRDGTRRGRRGMGTRSVRMGALLAAAAVGVATQSVWGEAVTANWKTAASGNWLDGSRWTTDPAVPNNGVPEGTTYQAVINASGIGYTVTVDQDITVDGVLLDSPNGSSVSQTGGTFTTANGLQLK